MTTALKENISDHVKESFDHPALKVESLPLTKKTIRLDYGENELSTPELFKASLIEAFIRQNISPNEIDLKAELSQFLKKRFGLNSHPQENFFFGLGITPLFAGLMEIAFQMKATLIVPQGTYGYFTAMAQFYNVPMVMIQTHLEQSYKMTAKDLQVALEGVYSPWIFLNMPVVNPTGAIYSPSEVYELLSVANLYKSVVIIDSIFSGLEFSASVIPQEFWNLEQALMNLPAQEGAFGGLEFVFLGGISKELSAGGIRFGFAYTRSLTLGQRLREILGQAPHIPHETILFAVKKIYYHLNHHTPTLMAHLIEQKGLLKNRAVQMSEILSQCGWTPLPPQGGLFLVAKPTKYLGKRMNGDILLTNKNLPLILFDKTDLLINGSEWTGIPDYCRFVLSVDEQVFKKALEALKKFSRIFE